MIDIYQHPLWCFDLDGTILEGSESFYQRCFQNAMLQFGIAIDSSNYPRGMNVANYLRLFWSEILSEKTQNDILQEYRNMQKQTAFTAQLYADAEVFLQNHASQKKVLVTNCSPETMSIVQQHIPLSSYFLQIIDRKPHFSAKPDPELYLFAASSFGYRPEECLAFEDSMTGIQAAISANMPVIALNRYDDLDKNHNANHTISSFSDLSFPPFHSNPKKECVHPQQMQC